MNRADNDGFSLIELCIVLIISGLLLAAGLKAFNVYLQQQEVQNTNDRLERIEEAISGYVSLYGFYPCPASLTAAPNTAQHSIASNCNAAAPAGIFEANGRGGRKVRIGALPVRTLEIGDSYAADGWGRRYTYAVTVNLAKDKASFDTKEGAIRIQDINGNPIVQGTAHYTLVSHGPDGKGGYASGGGLYAQCPAAARDQENCDRNAVFAASEDRSTASGANHYDDFVVFSSKAAATSGIPKCGANEVVTADGDKFFCVGAPSGQAKCRDDGTGSGNIICCSGSGRGRACWPGGHSGGWGN